MAFTKTIPLWSKEGLYTSIVSGKSFAPSTIIYDNKTQTVSSTYGDDLLYAITASESPEYISKAVICAFEALHLMHTDGFVHFDARCSNFIVCTGKRNPSESTPTDFEHLGKFYHVAIIDYETLFAPHCEQFDRESFDRDSVALSAFNRKSTAEYLLLPRCNVNRVDVFSLASSILHGSLKTNDANDPLLRACASILGHIPTTVSHEDEHGKIVQYVEYLTDLNKPVCSAKEAIERVAVAYLPSSLVSREWLLRGCNCDALAFCSVCTVDSSANVPHKNMTEITQTAFERCKRSTALFTAALKAAGLSETDIISLFSHLSLL